MKTNLKKLVENLDPKQLDQLAKLIQDRKSSVNKTTLDEAEKLKGFKRSSEKLAKRAKALANKLDQDIYFTVPVSFHMSLGIDTAGFMVLDNVNNDEESVIYDIDRNGAKSDFIPKSIRNKIERLEKEHTALVTDVESFATRYNVDEQLIWDKIDPEGCFN